MNRKILTTIILCFGLVITVWLTESSKKTALVEKEFVQNKVLINIDTEKSNYDWKKVLGDNSAPVEPIVNLTQNSSSDSFDETNITNQISRDVLARYLLFVNTGKTLDQTESQKIVDATLSVPDYTKTEYITYTVKDLKIVSNADLKIYKEKLNVILKKRSTEIKKDPLSVTLEALESKKEARIKDLDKTIETGRNFVKDLLYLETPSSVTVLHLNLINSLSKVLADTESMRLIFQDSVRGLNGLGEYKTDLAKFQNSLNNINIYLEKI